MKEVLEKNGFVLKSQCSCGGTLNQTFRKRVGMKSFEVGIQPKRGSWKLLQDGARIASGKEIELIDKLKEHGAIIEVKTAEA